MARVASLAAEVTADIGPLKTQMQQAGKSVQDFTRRARTQSRRFDDSMRNATRSSARFQHGVQNAAFQVGDFAVQVGGGTSAMRAMSMQLPQLLGGFGVFGAVAGAAVAIIGPLAQSLFNSADGASAAERAIADLSGTLGSIRGSVRELGDLQKRLNDLHRAQAGASGAGASVVLQNTKREFDARRQLIEVERTLLRLRSQDAIATLGALEEQQRIQRELAMERQRTLGPGATADNGSGGFAGGGLRMGDIQNSMLPSRLEEMQERSRQIQRLRAELELVDIAAQEADMALDGVFEASTDAVSGAGGGGSSGGRSAQVQRVKEDLSSMRSATQDALGGIVGDWGAYFNDVGSAMQSGNNRLLRIAKAANAAQAFMNTMVGATEALKLPFPANLAAFGKVVATGFGAVNAIKSIGGGGGAVGGGGAASTVAAASAATSPRVALTLSGSENATYTKTQVRGLINAINEEVENGAIVRLA